MINKGKNSQEYKYLFSTYYSKLTFDKNGGILVKSTGNLTKKLIGPTFD